MEVPEELKGHVVAVKMGKAVHLKCVRCDRFFFSVKDAISHIETQHGRRIHKRESPRDASHNF